MNIELALDETTIISITNPDSLGVLYIKTRDNENGSEWHDGVSIIADDQKNFERFISVLRLARELMMIDENEQ